MSAKREDGACTACGACCAAYLVSFPADELDSEPGGRVPAALADLLPAGRAAMRGSERQPPRCAALSGRIGESVSCAIYEFRPSACRDFAPLAAIGRGDAACDAARRRHGMQPLG